MERDIMSLLILNIIGGVLIASVFAGLAIVLARETSWKESSKVFGISFSIVAVLLLGAYLLTLKS